MVMPLPSHMRLPVSGHALPRSPRSPVKKHGLVIAVQPAAAVSTKPKLGSPQKLKAVVASHPSTTDVESSSSKGRLRAATLQAVLGLVDHDDDVLEQLLPLLHTLAALPLENENVQRQCRAALQQIQHHEVSALPVPFPRRDSGRARSSVSLRHCKAFLLACANEIHELEDVNPYFDYAEDTSSEAGPPQLRLHAVSTSGVFDYASTIDDASVSVQRDDDDDDDDDARADTGSQLSDLLIRTVEAEKDDCDDSATCRRVFSAWRATVKPRQQKVTLFRAFTALKQNRAASTLCRQRKQRAFRCLKALVRPSPTTTTMATTASSPPTKRIATLLLVHWDLVLLLLLACFVQLMRLQ